MPSSQLENRPHAACNSTQRKVAKITRIPPMENQTPKTIASKGAKPQFAAARTTPF